MTEVAILCNFCLILLTIICLGTEIRQIRKQQDYDTHRLDNLSNEMLDAVQTLEDELDALQERVRQIESQNFHKFN